MFGHCQILIPVLDLLISRNKALSVRYALPYNNIIIYHQTTRSLCHKKSSNNTHAPSLLHFNGYPAVYCHRIDLMSCLRTLFSTCLQLCIGSNLVPGMVGFHVRHTMQDVFHHRIIEVFVEISDTLLWGGPI